MWHKPSPKTIFRGLGMLLSLVLAFGVFSSNLWAAPPKAAKPKPAKLEISGYGLVGNFKITRLLRAIEGDRLKTESYDANLIEDIALILLSEVRREGFLHPTLQVRVELANGQKTEVTWKDEVGSLPRPLAVRKVQFQINEGIRYYYKHLAFHGLQTVKPKRAQAFFIETGVVPFRGTRVYSPQNLKEGISSLTEVLERQGYSEATATAGRLEVNDQTGAVEVEINVREGPMYKVRSVRVEKYVGGASEPSETRVIQTNRPYSRLWLDDFSVSLKATNFHRGYPDTTVSIQPLSSNLSPNLVLLALQATVKTGPQVRIGQVEFKGQKRTRESVMRNTVPLERGDLLDPQKTERGRSRLARLGVFDSVQLRYEPVTEQTRNVIYDVKEAKALKISLLAGYGSYELLRGGVEIQENNIWGRAHSARLRAIQSFKASSGDFTYSIPEVFGEDIDVFSRGFALRRDEISFTRQEYGGGLGLHRFFPSIATDLSGRYEYQVLDAFALGNNFAAVGPTNPGVGAVIFDLRHDRRDNPLYPRRGYKVFSTLEIASQYLAGDVTYERMDIATSAHHPLVGGLGVNLGLSHGFVTTPGTSEQDVPFNKRFFPGGAESIRGYQESEASPLNAEGKIIGAETYLLGTVELEQSITKWLSVVIFSDSLGMARSVKNYPFNETLYSVGGGLRFRTIVGPIRFEYGHNLNPRPQDPNGTFHFSLGFPF